MGLGRSAVAGQVRDHPACLRLQHLGARSRRKRVHLHRVQTSRQPLQVGRELVVGGCTDPAGLVDLAQGLCAVPVEHAGVDVQMAFA